MARARLLARARHSRLLRPSPAPAKFLSSGPRTDPLRLSIDDAVAFGLTRNLRLVTDRANLKIVKGDQLQVTNALVPSLSLNAYTNTQEINLAALGFKGSSLIALGLPPSAIHTIVKVDVTQAQLKLNQTLFNAPAYELLRGAKDESDVVNLNTLSGRGDLVLAVAPPISRSSRTSLPCQRTGAGAIGPDPVQPGLGKAQSRCRHQPRRLAWTGRVPEPPAAAYIR